VSITPLIFQTWKTRDNLPANFAYWSQTFRDQNPAYAYRLWDDTDNRTFIAKHYPWFLDRYDGFPAEIYRADAIRYFFLFHWGGIYADLDTECLKPLDSVLTAGDVVLGSMGTDRYFDHYIPNAVMMSKPRQEFWLYVISRMMDTTGPRPEYVTGPVLLRAAYLDYVHEYREDRVQNRIANIRSRLTADQVASRVKSNISVAQSHIFYPVNWNDAIHDEYFRKPMLRENKIYPPDTVRALFPMSFTVSYWAHSWEDQEL
jgi:mannosyltransferase OCH1-like enzyme